MKNIAFYQIYNFAPDQTQEYYFRNFPVLFKRSELRKGPRKCDVDSLLLQTLLRCDKNIHIISLDLILSDQITVIRLFVIYYFV